MPNAFQFRSLLGLGNTSGPEDAANNSAAISANGLDTRNLSFAETQGGAPVSQTRANRAVQARENLDVLMRQIEHARHDADQMIEDMSALEVTSGQANTLQRENAALREKLETSSREATEQSNAADSALREISRLKDELSRIRQDCETSQRAASANALDAERIEDRLQTALSALEETKRDLAAQRDAKDKAMVEAASLRANLAERDRVQSTLLQKETELRMQVAKLQSQNDEVSGSLNRKERSLLEKSAELDATRDRIAELEAEAGSSRDDMRSLGNKYSDLKVSQDARIFSLNDGLDQERESHRMTRKLLEEARLSNDELSDEIASLKDHTMTSTKDAQKLKRELGATRTQVHEYGDKLKETHLSYSAAQGDIQRLEAALDEAKRDAVTLRRQVNKTDQLLRENTDLHDKVASMQQSLDRYRGKGLLDDTPIMLSSTKASVDEPAKKSKAASHLGAGQNVARIARR